MKSKKIAKPLSSSRRFEEFVKSRDIILEDILKKYLRAIDRAVDHLKDIVGVRVTASHVQSNELYALKRSLSVLEHQLDQDFDRVERDVSALLNRMRTTVYAIAHIGQAEAMVRALGKDQVFDLSKSKIDSISNKDMRAGGPVEHRAWLAFEKLKRKIVSAYQRGILFDESTQEVLARVMDEFPRARKYKRVPKVIKHPTLKEAEDDEGTAFSLSRKNGEAFGIIDPDLWAQMVDDYKSKEIPFYAGRTTEDAEEYYQEHGVYEWEVEQQATQEFVDQVRAGESDAAKENDVIDFMWLAVLDSATDECCSERDGLTVTEIEEKLDSGELDDDVCDATSVPAHFNCRCALVPISEDLPDREPPSNGDFEDWLNSKS